MVQVLSKIFKTFDYLFLADHRLRNMMTDVVTLGVPVEVHIQGAEAKAEAEAAAIAAGAEG